MISLCEKFNELEKRNKHLSCAFYLIKDLEENLGDSKSKLKEEAVKFTSLYEDKKVKTDEEQQALN